LENSRFGERISFKRPYSPTFAKFNRQEKIID